MESAKVAEQSNVVELIFEEGVQGRITFLEENIFRYDVDLSGEFAAYATPRDEVHTAKIQQRPDESSEYTKPKVQILWKEEVVSVLCGETSVTWEKRSGKMQVSVRDHIVLEETEALEITNEGTVQTLVKNAGENFFGGGTQNGRFVHTGEKIKIVNESEWMDGGVASPNPFYYSTAGYGVLRNTFSDGIYDFGNENSNIVKTIHKESKFSVYFFVTEKMNGREVVQDLLRGYFHVTGNPLLLPEYGFYEGHLNCYNRDAWSKESGDKTWIVKGNDSSESEGRTYYESGMATGYRLTEGLHSESLNGTEPIVGTENYPNTVDTPYEYSARAVLDDYVKYDMPLGYFLPNDGYGGGYGQNGYYMQGGVNEDGSSSAERIAAVEANVENFADFTKYANSKGVASGLWTESNLSPDSNSETYWHLLRDFKKEVTIGGATTLKTDVAWVGPGYSFQLNGLKTAYDIVTTSANIRPNIISLDGWAGSQRFNSVWSGDQTGGNWEYIRFHIPTYIGSSLAGNPNIGSDMDGIFGGRPLIAVRDYEWKSFTPQMLNMDGWGTYMKAPFVFGDPYTGINRMYMKIKSQLMPYIYTCAAAAANIETGNGDTGLPMIRAMFLEYPKDEYAYGKDMKYQFMLGKNILVAPVYQDVAADEIGNDVRNRIYLPDENQVWIDYLTGEKYRGGQVLNNFAVPLWKLPVFVKNGAILPMCEPNNTPDEINRKNRIVEFWPEGNHAFTTYEDDGKYIYNDVEEVEGYGMVDHISYGNAVTTTYTSLVEGEYAILTVERSKGSYLGYEYERNTTFIVNVTQEPKKVKAKNGEKYLCIKNVNTKKEFDETNAMSGEAICFYDKAPELCTFASEDEKKFCEMVREVVASPKLYVKLATVDASAENQTVEILGFANEMKKERNRENEELSVPCLVEKEEKKTPTSIWLEWEKVEGAASYEMLADGKLFSMGKSTSYLHDELEYESVHTYRLRARNKDGYSKWSGVLTVETLLDPWRNEIGALSTITWDGNDENGALRYATDHSFKGMFFCVDDVVQERFPFIYDFGAVYELDKFEYYPRDNFGSGTVQKMNIYSSLDGKHWKLEWNGEDAEEWTYQPELEVEGNGKVVSLVGVNARCLKLIVVKSIRNYFAAHELPVYKKDGAKPFAAGSTNRNEKVSEGDYTNMKNYLGTSEKDGSNFTDQIQKRCGDINMNGVYDVYDYAYTMFQLDGGTQQTGSVAGNVSLVPQQKKVKAEESFVVAVEAENVQNLNAFGKVLHYNPEHLEFISIDQEERVDSMENLTVNKRYEDGTAYLNLAFANRGNKKTYSGSGRLAFITMKALVEIEPSLELECENVWLIGPQFDVLNM